MTSYELWKAVQEGPVMVYSANLFYICLWDSQLKDFGSLWVDDYTKLIGPDFVTGSFVDFIYEVYSMEPLPFSPALCSCPIVSLMQQGCVCKGL